MNETPPPNAPWLSGEVFPEKPTNSEYGYFQYGKLFPCTREELIHRCSIDDAFSEIVLVWHPDAPRLVPVQHTPFLIASVKDRLKKRLLTNLLSGGFCLISFGGLMFLTWESKGGHEMFIFLLFAGGLLPVAQSVYGLNQLKKLQFEQGSRQETVYRYNAWVNSNPLRFTWLILGILGLVFIVEVLRTFPVAVDAAGFNKHDVWRGEWWRFLTGPLMHGSVMHFIFNATALIGLGRVVELLASRFHLALIFVIGTLCGSIFSLFLLPNTTSVGASGGLLGLIGFLGILGWRRKQLLPPGFVKSVITNVAIIALMGIVAFTLIDNAAHFGGLVGGAIAGFLLVPTDEKKLPLVSSPMVKVLGTISLVLIIMFSFLGIEKIFTH